MHYGRHLFVSELDTESSKVHLFVWSDLQLTGTGIFSLDFGICSWDFFYGLRMSQSYQLVELLTLRLLKPFFDNVLLELGHVISLAVHLERLGTPFWHSVLLKVMGWGVGVAHKILVSSSDAEFLFPFWGLDSGLGLCLELGVRGH